MTSKPQQVLAQLKQARQARGITQKELARRLGVSQAIISQWENGRRRVSFEDLVAMAEAIGINWHELID